MTDKTDVVLSLRDVGVRYKRRGRIFRKPEYYQALEGVSFDLYRGETLGIIGRNGAGKSTLLRVIAGIIKPDQGKVINFGVSVSLLALQAGFDPELSGRDNAIMNGMLLGYTRKQVETCMNDIIEFSELNNFIDEPVKTYSSGMRSRLGFSVSVFMTPDVLLLDEVLSVGDKSFREKAEAEMKRKLNTEQTIVLVSHSEGQIKRLADSILKL